MRRLLLGLSLGMAALGSQGCTECRVALRDSNGANAQHSSGMVFGNQYIVAAPDPGQMTSQGIQEVIVKDNFLYDLIGVVTLGFFKPTDITYRNVHGPADDSGEMSTPRPPAGGGR